MSWLAARSRSARNRSNSTRGAPLNAATAAWALTNRWRRSGESSPTGTPFLVTTKDSPWSSWRIISPLLLRSSRWVISLATPKCGTCATPPCTVPGPRTAHRRRSGRYRRYAGELLAKRLSGGCRKPGLGPQRRGRDPLGHPVDHHVPERGRAVWTACNTASTTSSQRGSAGAPCRSRPWFHRGTIGRLEERLTARFA